MPTEFFEYIHHTGERAWKCVKCQEVFVSQTKPPNHHCRLPQQESTPIPGVNTPLSSRDSVQGMRPTPNPFATPNPPDLQFTPTSRNQSSHPPNQRFQYQQFRPPHPSQPNLIPGFYPHHPQMDQSLGWQHYHQQQE